MLANDYIPDDETEVYASVLVASGSDATPESLGMGQDFQIIALIAIGIMIGILLIGSRRFK